MHAGRSALPTVAFTLALVAAGSVVAGVVAALAGPFVGVFARTLGMAMTSSVAVGALLGLMCAIGAIVAGHRARRRYPGDTLGGAALIIGWCTAGGIVLVALAMVGTWLSIMQSHR
jgi:hypothetical protein